MSNKKELLRSKECCKLFQKQEKPWIEFCKKYYTEGSPNGSLADNLYLASIIYFYARKIGDYQDFTIQRYSPSVRLAVDNFIASLNLKVRA